MNKQIMQAVVTELASYQDNAIVSKTIIKKDKGTITLFAFDKGQELSEHTAPFDAMVYVLDGTADVTVAGKLIHLGTGEMIILPANISHALKASEKFKMMLIMIRSR